jgi:hypothetical protein
VKNRRAIIRTTTASRKSITKLCACAMPINSADDVIYLYLVLPSSVAAALVDLYF